jgi:hypothetical protein
VSHAARPLWERFEEKFVADPNGGCWFWLSATGTYDGYGYFTVRRGFVGKAHRIAYEHYKGRIPKGKELDHLCRTPHCINPEHVEPVTHQVNMLRGHNVASWNAAKTHCPQGHALIGKNLWAHKSGKGTQMRRRCRICVLAQNKAGALKKNTL